MGRLSGQDRLETKIDTVDSILDNVHDTDLPAVKTVVDGVETHVHAIETKVDTLDTIIDNLHDTDIPDIHTDVASLRTDIDTIDTNVDSMYPAYSGPGMRITYDTMLYEKLVFGSGPTTCWRCRT